MNKGTHIFGQPVYGQLIKCLDKDKIIEKSRNLGGERYVKSFDGWHHLLKVLINTGIYKCLAAIPYISRKHHNLQYDRRCIIFVRVKQISLMCKSNLMAS